MPRITILLLAISTTLLSITLTASAKHSKVTPCVIGNGNDELCDSCDDSKAIEVTSWANATWVKNFTMSDAPSDTGPGYKVHWRVEQPAESCRILLFDTFNTDKDSIERKLSGRVRLSVNKGGCYMATIRSGGVGAGACCGSECANIGAFPSAPTAKRDRLLRFSSMEARPRAVLIDRPVTISGSAKYRASQRRGSVEKRGSGGQNPNPFDKEPAPPAPQWNCEAKKNGGTYTKSGKQVVNGKSFSCGSDIGCDMSVDFQVSVASSVSSEKTTTYTNSKGITHEASVGWMYAGPMATYTFSYNKDFSEAVASSTGTSNTDTKSSGVTLREELTPGFQYNGWWAPTLMCQMWTLSCDQGQGPIEKCDPLLDATGGPVGEQGIMTTGRA